jgi:hypothetical protein
LTAKEIQTYKSCFILADKTDPLPVYYDEEEDLEVEDGVEAENKDTASELIDGGAVPNVTLLSMQLQQLRNDFFELAMKYGWRISNLKVILM